jgi:5'(3')-deoxyribonucleotidase
MINPASVAFDFDGVIADTMSLFLDIARDEFHVDGIRYEDITCYNLADCIDMDPEIIEAVVSRILDGRHRTPLKPIEGAPEVLARIGRFHRPVLFVTARPYVGPICDWLLNFLPFEPESVDVVAVGTHEGKADILLNRQIACFVEDRLETCYALHEVGIVPIVFKQPWNREPHPFVEVGSWSELEELIEF